MGYPITLIREGEKGAGDIAAVQTAIDATGVTIDWQVIDVSLNALNQSDTLLSNYVLDAIRETKTILKGPLTMPIGLDPRWIEADIRERLDLYVNLRPAKTMVGTRSNFQNVDLVIVRETTEDIYAGIEFERTSIEAADARSFLSKLSGKRIREDSAVGIKPISVRGCGQIIEFAFNYARNNGRSKVTAIHQAHIMAHTDGLFLEIARDIAQEFPEIAFEDRSVETVCRELMQTPDTYDVLVMPNLYGDLLSHLCAGMVGGVGAPNAYIGDKYAVFEAQSTRASQALTDPTSLILSGVLMLQHLGERDAALKLQTAVETVIAAQVATAGNRDLMTEVAGLPTIAQAIAEAVV